MANIIKVKRGSRTPTTSDLEINELGYSTNDKTLYINDSVNIIPIGASLTGSVIMYAGETAPDHYMICDGAAISRTTYAKLFALIGTTYGTGNGSTTFNLPDLRARFPIGSNGGDLGGKGGSADAIIVAHNHTEVSNGSHTHTFTGSSTTTSNVTPSDTGAPNTPYTSNTTPGSTGTPNSSYTSNTTPGTGGAAGSHAHTIEGRESISGGGTGNYFEWWSNGTTAKYITSNTVANHSHTGASHNHSLNSHTHSSASHNHSLNSHTHTSAAHAHTVTASGTIANNGDHIHTINSTGSIGTNANLPPYIIMNFIIKID